MALSIGELVGYIDLDTSGAEGAVGRVGGLLSGKGGKWTAILGGLGAGAGVVFGASLMGAVDREVGSDRLAASLGKGSQAAERYGAIAGEVFSNGFGEGLEDVNTAMGAVVTSIKGMRNASDTEVQKMTEKAMTLADVMGVDVTRAAQVAGNMVYNGMAKDGTQAFDLLMKAMQKVPVQLREDVMDATDEYGQFFSQLGIDGPAAMALLATGAEKGMYGIDKAGDAIKEFTIRATDGSKSSLTAFESMGLNGVKMGNDLLAGGDKAKRAFDKTLDGILSIKDPTEKASTALSLFGTPLEDLGTKDIPGFLKSLQTTEGGLGKFEGAVDKAGKTAYDNASGNLTSFKRSLQTGFVDLIGGKVLPKLTDLTGSLSDGLGPAYNTVRDAVKDATAFITDNKDELGIAAGVIATVFIPHLVAMGVTSTVQAAKVALSWLVTSGGAIAAAVVHSAQIAGMVAKWVLLGVQSMIHAAKVAAAWLIAMGPIGLVIALVAGLVALIVANWDTIKAKTKAIWEAVSGAVADAWDTVKTKVSDGVAKVVDFVKAIPGKIGGALSDLGSTLRGKFGDAFAAAKDKASNVWDTIQTWVTSLPGKISNGLSNLTETVRTLFRDAMDAGKEKVTGIGGTIVSWIEAIPGKILGKLESFKNAGASLLQGFVDGMKNAAGVIEGIAGNVWSAVRGLINGAIGKINAALEFTIDLPGPKNVTINPPDIPQLATGGRATAATLAVIGEGREPESVLPDSVLRGLLERAHAAGAAQGRNGYGGNAPLIGQVVAGNGMSADELAERLWFKTRTRG